MLKWFQKNRKAKRRVCIFCAVVIALGSLATNPISTVYGVPLDAAVPEDNSEYGRQDSYYHYVNLHADATYPDYSISIQGVDYSATDMEIETVPLFEGEDNIIKLKDEDGYIEWDVDIPESGFYAMSMKYYPLPYRGRDIEVSLLIDGDMPFEDAYAMQFFRTYTNETEIMQDSRGNDLTPLQIEAPIWRTADFKGTKGFFSDSFQFYFEKGTHKIRLISEKEIFALKEINIYHKKEMPSYQEVRAEYEKNGYKPASQGIELKYQGEHADYKSSPQLRPINDRSSAATEPSAPTKIKLNTIGQWNWKMSGQWVSWIVDVPEDGLYKLALKYRQSFERGLFTSRNIYIDGEIPFQEFKDVRFQYDLQWKTEEFGNKTEPYLVYLTKGTHEIMLEATLGDNAKSVIEVDELVYRVNTLYRKIIMITGVDPDLFRDYELQKEIPGLTKEFEDIASKLITVANEVEEMTGVKGSETALLRRMAEQLLEFCQKPDSIPARLMKFRENISGLSMWILYRQEQPLEIDYILLDSPEMSLPSPSPTLWESIAYSVNGFLGSFTEDYTSVGDTAEGGETTITAWVSAGRDSAEIINSMIIDDFTPKTGINVKVSLVPSFSGAGGAQNGIVEATLAGKGPDVAMQIERGHPVNLALRGALADLNQFEDYTSVKERFMPTAMDPYSFQGKTYGLPVTQDYYMMFYRKDIFEELGISPPETWSDLYSIIPTLQRNNMEVGLPFQKISAQQLITNGMGTRNLFPVLLLQHGADFYSEEGDSSGLLEPEALEAFKQWTDFYRKYNFTLIYEFYNRFRTGEMPIGISTYTTYSMFAAAAPEIRNQWGMLPVPGTVSEDGTINRSQGDGGSAAIIFEKAENKEACWEFIKWWTDASVQRQYGLQMEAIIGSAARYNTANVEAFSYLPWNKEEYDSLMAQWQEVKSIREVPGGYYTARALDLAFRDVTTDWKNPREVFTRQAYIVNEEIMRKWEELGLIE